MLCLHCNNRKACNLPIQRVKKGLRLMIDICVQRMGGLLITPLKSSFLFVPAFFTGFLCLFFARETFFALFWASCRISRAWLMHYRAVEELLLCLAARPARASSGVPAGTSALDKIISIAARNSHFGRKSYVNKRKIPWKMRQRHGILVLRRGNYVINVRTARAGHTRRLRVMATPGNRALLYGSVHDRRVASVHWEISRIRRCDWI